MSLEDLYRFGKIQKHKTSQEEIKNLFDVADRCLKDASQENISLDLRFVAVYQAALAVAESLLCCNGYKAPKGNYHYMTWEGLRNIHDDYIKKSIILFDSARQKRGAAFYDHTDVVSEVEFNELFKEAKAFISYIKAKIKKEYPDYGFSL